MNAYAVDTREPRMFRVIDEINTVGPTDIARASKKFGGHRSRNDAGCAGEQITFLHHE
jgi:hypothetical protein